MNLPRRHLTSVTWLVTKHDETLEDAVTAVLCLARARW